MNITLSARQIDMLAKFAGFVVVESTDAAVLSRQVAIVESSDGMIIASYWDDTKEGVVVLALGQRPPPNG